MAGRLHYLCQLGAMDVLCEVKLLESSLHLCLKSIHRDGGRCILDKGIIGPIVFGFVIGGLEEDARISVLCFLDFLKYSNVSFSHLILFGWGYPYLLIFIPGVVAVVESSEFDDLCPPSQCSTFTYGVNIESSKDT